MSQTKVIAEGSCTIKAYQGTVSKKLPVFYNPVMEFNRTSSILLLNTIKKENMQLALPLSGSGIRGVRFLKELKKDKIKSITFNDYSKNAITAIKSHLKQNNIKITKNIVLSQNEANLFLLESSGFDYIDIDPFGTPNPFLDAAIRRISREGILAVTATDTSALCGTYENACKRKYWATPKKDAQKHETGLRILIRKVQLIGAQYEKALVPIFSFSKDHYMRTFLLCKKGKSEVDKIQKQHKFYKDAGPLWTGQLWDKTLTKNMSKQTDDKIVQLLAKEATINAVGFHDIHDVCKKHKIGILPKHAEILEVIKKRKHKATYTHFSPTGIRSTITEKELVKVIKKLASAKKKKANKERKPKTKD